MLFWGSQGFYKRVLSGIYSDLLPLYKGCMTVRNFRRLPILLLRIAFGRFEVELAMYHQGSMVFKLVGFGFGIQLGGSCVVISRVTSPLI